MHQQSSRIQPDEQELELEAFLREANLHESQVTAGYRFYDRRYSRSDTYAYFVSVDLSDPNLRRLVSDNIRQNFRFGVVADTQARLAAAKSGTLQAKHPQELHEPMEHRVKTWLNIREQFITAKQQVMEGLIAAGISTPSPKQVADLLALILTRFHYLGPGISYLSDLDKITDEVYDWLKAEVNTFCLLHRFAYRSKDKQVMTLAEAVQAAGMPTGVLAALYLPEETD